MDLAIRRYERAIQIAPCVEELYRCLMTPHESMVFSHAESCFSYRPIRLSMRRAAALFILSRRSPRTYSKGHVRRPLTRLIESPKEVC